MKHVSSLRKSLILFVFFILIITGFISFILLYLILKNYGSIGVAQIRRVPILLIIIATIVAIAVGTLVTIIISKTVLKPLQQVINATKEIGQSNFNYTIPETNLINNKKTEITELISSFNVMTQQLASIELFKNDFINNFSHEFKTPISSIIGFAEELERDDITKEERKLYLSIIISESKRLANLSSNILLLTKLENQMIITNKKTFSLDEQIRNTILMMQDDWKSKNVNLELSLEAVEYYGNPELIKQIWINLINNAIKFTDENGTIKINLKTDDTKIIVVIEDNGIGMEPEIIKHIFDKFYQGDASRATKGKGLGLSLVKKIVDLSKGTIEVKSKIDQGTTFTIYLDK
ncbi:HAMP domain-containing sensor histidine kinase [uncultured Thomasclavelia sp.]|uniref:HAMP domain-containing sensor histidine kinase n=1 Tax=uncultured Thomasclavelia sp. TaxID=3025759 RepID=UPI0025D7C1BE|nr:HAMP domain-containing sensor histidine kinase [uncultured Thomasclavelia sp.]